jgi:hypothetical protein
MNKRVQFYATTSDLLQVLTEVEQKAEVQYIQTGNNTHSEVLRYIRGLDIPNLGIADHQTGSVCRAFLVMLAKRRLNIETFRGSDGLARYSIDQMANDDSVVLTPAGLWANSILLGGEVATLSSSSDAVLLMKAFRSAIRRRFSVAGTQWIGPEATSLWASGYRLTISAQSPLEYDLDYNRFKDSLGAGT